MTPGATKTSFQDVLDAHLCGTRMGASLDAGVAVQSVQLLLVEGGRQLMSARFFGRESIGALHQH